MKNFRKFLAAGIAAVMVFSLAGCGGSKAKTVTLEGTWNATTDVTASFGAGFDSGMDAGGDRKFSEYIPEMIENISITFNSDGTYELLDSTDVDTEAFQDSYIQYLTDVLAEDNGGTPLTEAELVEVFGTADLREATAEFFSEEEMNGLFGQTVTNGSYTNTDGAIELDNGITGTFDGQTLTMDLTELIDVADVVFTKA